MVEGTAVVVEAIEGEIGDTRVEVGEHACICRKCGKCRDACADSGGIGVRVSVYPTYQLPMLLPRRVAPRAWAGTPLSRGVAAEEG